MFGRCYEYFAGLVSVRLEKDKKIIILQNNQVGKVKLHEYIFSQIEKYIGWKQFF